MPQRNGATSNYGIIEDSLLKNDWSPEERCVFIALLVSFDNSYRVGTVALWEIQCLVTALQIADCQGIGKALPISRISEVLISLQNRGSIKQYDGNKFWVVDGWSYTGSMGNPKRENGAREYINRHFPMIWKDFAEFYGLPIDCQPVGKALATGKGKGKGKDINTLGNFENPVSNLPEEKPEKQESEKIQKRNQELVPLAERLAEIVSKAESNLGITRRADNSTEKIINTVRSLVDIDKYRPSEIELCARWAFLYSGDEKFYLANLTYVANWRKQWSGGKAFTVTFQKWEVAGRPDGPGQGKPTPHTGRRDVAGTETLDLGR